MISRSYPHKSRKNRFVALLGHCVMADLGRSGIVEVTAMALTAFCAEW